MDLSQALNTALSGLNVTQADLAVTAANVANANTPGYVLKQSVQVETAGDGGISVDTAGINRELNTQVQSQLWTESAGGSFADAQAQFYQQLQSIYGTPGSSNAFDSAFNTFTSALQTLSTSPSSSSAQTGAVSAAQGLAQNLNSMTTSIQGLRTQAEQGIASDVQQANAALQQIAQINQQLAGTTQLDATAASLEDQRDQAIGTLATLMNVNVVQGNNNQVSVFTSAGTQLVGTQASQLTFDNVGSLSAGALWSSNPDQDGAGTISLVSPSGTTTDLLATNQIQSGQIAAYVQMRDHVLPQAQSQLDELASQMSQALSNQTTAGTAVTAGAQSGFGVDVGGLLPGNSVQITYTDSSNNQHTVTIVNSAVTPLPDSTTSDPDNQVIGVDFSQGLNSVVSQLNNQLGPALQFSNPSGTMLQVLNNAAGSTTINSVSATTTTTSLTSGSPQIPLFADGNSPISGAITAGGSQEIGLAGRITVNPAVVANPTSLVVYQNSPATSIGDSTRPNFMLNQLTQASLTYSPATGLGSQNAPFTGTLPTYLSQVISQQGQAATSATNLQQGQDAVVSALQQRLDSDSGVNIDQEMSNLINLQNAYAANARVMTTIQQMMQALIQS